MFDFQSLPVEIQQRILLEADWCPVHKIPMYPNDIVDWWEYRCPKCIELWHKELFPDEYLGD